MASHNGRYYVKKVTKKYAGRSKTIDEFFNSKSKKRKVDEDTSLSNQQASDTASANSPKSGVDLCQSKSFFDSESKETESDVNSQSCVDSVETTASTSTETETSTNAESESDTSVNIDTKSRDNRKFYLTKYTSRYPWLYFNHEKSGFMCKLCELAYSSGTVSSQDSPFISSGVNSLGTHPTRKLDKHDNCSSHSHAKKVQSEIRVKLGMKNYEKKSVLKQLIEQNDKESRQQKERNVIVLRKLFKSIYFIERKKWAQSNFEDFIHFVANLGVEELQKHIETAPKYATYLSTKTATELIELIGKNIEHGLLESLRQAPFFSLLADESTDEANNTQLAIFCRWYHKGTFTDHFMGLIEVTKTDSASLMGAIKLFLNEKEIEISKCRFVAFDGTNTMSGEVSGLQRRFRHYSPLCLYVNCRNHRLALCLKHLMKTFPLLVEVDENLLAIWKLFKFSPKRFGILNEIQEIYGLEPLTMVRAATTRWLSHGKASVRFIERYEVVLDALDAIYDQKKEPEVFGLSACLTKKPFVAMVCVLCDVLAPVNRLSLYLQGANVILCNVEAKVAATISDLCSICEHFQQNPINQDLYVSRLENLCLVIDERTDLQRRLRGYIEQFNISDFLRDVGVKFINSLVREIQDAFYLHPVSNAFRRALDPTVIPENATVVDLRDYGKDALTTLIQHYGNQKEDTFQNNVVQCEADINLEETEAEYAGLKHTVNIQKKQRGMQANDSGSGHCALITPSSIHEMLHHDIVLAQTFPMMLKLYYLLNIIPASTASVERCFSQMNLLKTPLRSRLSGSVFDALMRINIEGEKELLEAQLDQLIQAFRNAKDRLYFV